MASLNKQPRIVLLDIDSEGTVCPISFVKDVLFPYALSALPSVLQREWDSPSFRVYRDAFPAEYAASQEALFAHVRDLVARDVKIAYLKSLQGYLWESGYASGELKAPLFPDVAPRIVKWTEEGWGGENQKQEDEEGKKVKVMIYSSGSVPAQKLFFGHTDATPESDLRPRISGWFDTVNAGPKTETESYKRILESGQHIPADEWLFLSDNVREVAAAKEAGMQSFVVERPGNAPLSEEDRAKHRVVRSFDEL
ncbi:hypothetical protein VTJ49DRAFT_5791 [Mycothermus thermophilus]|uniref:Enolase-phosphatase E1 n=1 Tax=Humicola insolens TaxID=85995 RepID=A0ABR3VQF7_HUMIN